jgi:diphthine-ammonia ligase
VEIKPILYVPTDDGYGDDDDVDGDITRELDTGASKPASSKLLSEWSTKYSDLCDSCCLIHTVAGKICSAVVSITNDIASKICSTTEHIHHSEEHLKAIARFCAFQLAKILIDNGFTWDNVTVSSCHGIT